MGVGGMVSGGISSALLVAEFIYIEREPIREAATELADIVTGDEEK